MPRLVVDSSGLRRCSTGNMRSRQSVGSAARSLLFLHHPQEQKASTITPSQADEDALTNAALKGNVKEVLRLLDKGVNQDYKNSVQILLFSLIRCARTSTHGLLIKKLTPLPLFIIIY